MIKNALTIAAMVLAAASLAACSPEASQEKKESGATAQKTGEVVAVIGNDVITLDELKAKMEEQAPFIRARYDTTERKREFLDNLVRFELLAQEAQKRGLADDPDVQAAMKKTMVQKLMRSEFDESKAGPEVTEAAMRAFYDENVNDFVKPERVRSSHIFFAAAKGDAGRAKVKTEATRALAEMRKSAADKNAFSNLAKTRSDDDASKRAGGDLSFKTKEELTEAWGPEFANAVVALAEIGDIGNLVESDKGFHVIRITGRQNALDRPFDSVKGQIESRLSREQRTKSFDAFVENLKSNAKLEIHEELLAKIEIGTDTQQQMGMPTGISPLIPAAPSGPKSVVIPAKATEPKK